MAYNYEYPYEGTERYNNDWLLNKMKELTEEWEKVRTDWKTQQEQFESLKTYIMDYFNNLDVQEEINKKIESMVADGSFQEIVEQYLTEYQTEVADLRSVQNNMQQQIDNLVLQAGNPDSTSAEIAQARGSFSTLNARLNTMVASQGRLSAIQQPPLNDLNTFPTNTIYEIFSSAYSNTANKPDTNASFATVITFSGINSNNTPSSREQIYISSRGLYYRQYLSNNWSAWSIPLSASNLISINGRLTAIADLDDLDNFPASTIYELSGTAYSSCLNKPETSSNFATILTFTGSISSGLVTTRVQLYIAGTGVLYSRCRVSNAWTAWNGDSGTRVLTSDYNNPLSFRNTKVEGNGHVIDLGHVITSSSTGDIKEIPYPYTEGDFIDQVFVSKTLPISDESSTRSAGYYVTIWDNNTKLIPTLNATPQTGEFTYRDNTFYINSPNTTFILNDVNDETALTVWDSEIYNLTVLHASRLSIYIRGNSSLYGVKSSYCSLADGFSLVNSSGEYVNCEASYNRNDGFNIHTYQGESTTKFIDCIAEHNYDDGISHHDTSKFTIIGGKYSNNGKGGIASPTYGAYGSVYNAVVSDNLYGMYIANTGNVNEVNLCGLYFVNNTTAILNNNYTVNCISCIFDNNTNMITGNGTTNNIRPQA